MQCLLHVCIFVWVIPNKIKNNLIMISGCYYTKIEVWVDYKMQVRIVNIYCDLYCIGHKVIINTT